MSSAQFYNAVCHELHRYSEWQDMEALILIHSTQRIFWRDRHSSSPMQYSKSFEAASGASVIIAQHGDNCTSRGIKPKTISVRAIAPVSFVSTQYHERVCFEGNKDIETPTMVEMILNYASDNLTEYSIKGLRLLEAPNTPPPNDSSTFANLPQAEDACGASLDVSVAGRRE